MVGSKDELETLSGRKVDDLHRHFIDDITIPSKQVLPSFHLGAQGWAQGIAE